MSLNQKPSFSVAPVLGACLAVISSVPLTAFLASSFGDTYNTRVIIYAGTLLWVIIGALIVFSLTKKDKSAFVGFRFLALWFVSSWLWPVLLLTYLYRSSQGSKKKCPT